jgi:hypothetical protein
MIFHCANPECPEYNVEKNAYGPLRDGNILCGYCNRPVLNEAGLVVEGPIDFGPDPSPTLSLEERVTALEEFNAELITALQTVFDPANDTDASSLSDLLRSN